MKLFCLPYAGGSSFSYLKWKSYLHEAIEMVPVELAGRGKRIRAPLYNSLQEAVVDAYDQIVHEVDGEPYAIFGHSMGAWIAYELAHHLVEAGHAPPALLLVSGRRAPDVPSSSKRYYNVSDPEFLQLLQSYEGMSAEILRDQQLLDLFLPVIRNDFKIVETYEYIKHQHPLSCDMLVLNGKQDREISYADLLTWKKHSRGASQIYEFDGGHFFVFSAREKVVNLINDQLMRHRIRV